MCSPYLIVHPDVHTKHISAKYKIMGMLDESEHGCKVFLAQRKTDGRVFALKEYATIAKVS